jgi:hypothetical protein
MPGRNWRLAFPPEFAHLTGREKRITTEMAKRRRQFFGRWSFWLLLVAWLVANRPQSATYALLEWLGEARSFAHQQRLKADVAAILGGESVRRETRGLTMAAAGEEAPPAPPQDAVLQRIQLWLEPVPAVAPRGTRTLPRVAGRDRCPECWRAPPPHEPPRASRA